ncbi:helix-turn-helix domain-containing protein [Varunaivibrio sulfuroxidans]|uniref:helix-turn-helix domain-containing protein n=1 Tax=Varunaivibrio sulfuroxidans TaxID=1773489 RepID=UPI0023E25B4F|nr:helix-turn-helix domain-containing protein [Varunaivibrio sulfuroxidans]WES29616.1 helix-turn-helix domain-containing protein [Varunaivibrio sulfuroxidans]
MSESETPIFEKKRDNVPGDAQNDARNDAQDDALPDRAVSAVGALLQASRRRAGEDLDDVANLLRISRRYLQAIEAGDMKALPGAAYALGFVRAYADHLGLDSAEVVRRFKLEVSATQTPSELVFPSPIPESGIPGGAILFFGALIAVLAYGGWYYTTNKQKDVNAMVEPVPSRLANDAGVTLNTSPHPAPTGITVAPDRVAVDSSPAAPAATDTSPTTAIQAPRAPSGSTSPPSPPSSTSSTSSASLRAEASPQDAQTPQTQPMKTQTSRSEAGNGASAGIGSKPQASPSSPATPPTTLPVPGASAHPEPSVAQNVAPTPPAKIVQAPAAPPSPARLRPRSPNPRPFRLPLRPPRLRTRRSAFRGRRPTRKSRRL